jgi:hypothetical protein
LRNGMHSHLPHIQLRWFARGMQEMNVLHSHPPARPSISRSWAPLVSRAWHATADFGCLDKESHPFHLRHSKQRGCNTATNAPPRTSWRQRDDVFKKLGSLRRCLDSHSPYSSTPSTISEANRGRYECSPEAAHRFRKEVMPFPLCHRWRAHFLSWPRHPTAVHFYSSREFTFVVMDVISPDLCGQPTEHADGSR